jgi:hypothetical protein
MKKRPRTRLVSRLTAYALLSGCGSGYTIVDRSSVVVSSNSRIAAATLFPGNEHPEIKEHLALAQEMYQKQLNLLKERRNKVRARHRDLGFMSWGLMAASGLAAGGAAVGSANTTRQSDALIGAGATALAGLGLGVVLQIASLMQEDPAAVDEKIRHLQTIYDAMLDRVRTLASQQPLNEPQIGAAIESFINEAEQINVKG